MPRHSLDHNVMVVQSASPFPKPKASFKFLNLWVVRGDFLGLAADTWQTPVDGNLMYRLTKILGLLKPK